MRRPKVRVLRKPVSFVGCKSRPKRKKQVTPSKRIVSASIQRRSSLRMGAFGWRGNDATRGGDFGPAPSSYQITRHGDRSTATGGLGGGAGGAGRGGGGEVHRVGRVAHALA